MESPPSYSAHSEAPLLSEDSGLIITSGSFSSDSASGWPQISSELQESDFDEKSLSLYESSDPSERMCADNFNTVKKGPTKVLIVPIEPPPQFQDSPIFTRKVIDGGIDCFMEEKDDVKITVYSGEPLILQPTTNTRDGLYQKMTLDRLYVTTERRHYHRFTSPRLLHLSPCHAVTRPASRNSLTSRLSSSHNSLVTQLQADDSSFITQAISHDTLSTTTDIADMYNVPFDSDIYAVPIDMVRPTPSRQKPKRPQRTHRKRDKSSSRPAEEKLQDTRIPKLCVHLSDPYERNETKRHSIAGPSNLRSNSISGSSDVDPMHMTLHEVRKYLQTLYSSSSESEGRSTVNVPKTNAIKQNGAISNNKCKSTDRLESSCKSNIENNNNLKPVKKSTLYANNSNKNKKYIEVTNSKEILNDCTKKTKPQKQSKSKKSPAKKLTFNLKQTFCNLFRLKRGTSMETSDGEESSAKAVVAQPPPLVLRRALPPVPPVPPAYSVPRRLNSEEENVVDFATSIQKVKDCGWYWGPISVEAAEKVLSNEPDGSFIVRDSSDDHYIFTLTFKLNGMRHVRIEHEQGNFCFGSCTMFKARTIIEFIENAVETSRSGRYLFFLNLRPLLGPVRVQLLYPVSRFKRVQSLQHMCRFVILKVVRKDLINDLPLPRRLLDYLNASHYYSEQLADI